MSAEGAGLTVRGQPVLVEHRGGHRFSARVRDHEVVLDQPRGSGGQDAGPTPTELLVVSLAACVAHYGQRFLERHGLPGAVGAEAAWWADLGAERLTRVEIRVEAPPIPPELEEGFRHALEHCLVHNSMREPPEVTIEVGSG